MEEKKLEPFDINKYINDHLLLLPINSSLLTQEAESKASKLLYAIAVLASYRLNYSNQLSKAISMRDISYTEALVGSDCKNVTEKKAIAEASNNHTKNREETEVLDANIKYLSTIIDVFNNGHILYRQISRGNV